VGAHDLVIERESRFALQRPSSGTEADHGVDPSCWSRRPIGVRGLSSECGF
jgi:hypothetical protein